MQQSSTGATGANGQDALTDIGHWLYHGFFVPGDYVASNLATYAPPVAQFLGLDTIDHGSLTSGIISAVVWLGAIVVIVAACRLIRDLDRALTAAIGRLFQRLLSAGRMVARRLGIALRFFQLRRQARLARTEVSEQVALTALELAVLQSHAKLAPGHLLTANDIACALKVRSSTQVEKALSRLAALSLVHRTFGAGDGEDGYRLSRPGELFLAAYGRPHVPNKPSRQTETVSARPLVSTSK